jgi:hypothetical protein
MITPLCAWAGSARVTKQHAAAMQAMILRRCARLCETSGATVRDGGRKKLENFMVASFIKYC